MPSFAAFSLLTTLALSAFTSAAPAGLIPSANHPDLTLFEPIARSEASSPTPKSLVLQATAQISACAQELSHVTASNGTVQGMSPCINLLVDVLTHATVEIKDKCAPAQGSAGGNGNGSNNNGGDDNNNELAKDVYELLCIVDSALNAVLEIVGNDVQEAGALVDQVAVLLEPFVASVLNSTVGLLEDLVPLVEGLVPTLLKLNLQPLLNLFKCSKCSSS